MAKALKSEPVAPGAPSAEFESARERWSELSATHAKLSGAIEGMRSARSLVGANAVPEVLKEQVAPYAQLARQRPRKLNEMIADAESDLAEFLPQYFTGKEEFDAACSRETNRISLALQPRHRAAVKAMATAVEMLSQAIADEREVRAELRRIAPTGTSANLPNVSDCLAIGTLDDWRAPAAEWRRLVHRIGVLK